MEISVVLPVYNEEDNLVPLFEELSEVLKQNFSIYEIIFVDDGSQDSSLKILKRLTKENEAVKLIELRRNFGQTDAIQAGIDRAKGDLIALMDSDMQNDPKDIPHLIKELETIGADMICGWRKDRKDPLSKGLMSKISSLLRKIVIKAKINDYGCTLKIFRKEAADFLNLQGEMHRYIPALLKMHGFKVSEKEVNHRERNSGKSKYSLRRLPKGFIDMLKVWFLKEFRGRPLHIFGGLGIFSIFSGIMLFLLALYQKFNGVTLSDTAATTISVFLVLIGFQFFLSGILAEIIVTDKVSKSTGHKVRNVIE